MNQAHAARDRAESMVAAARRRRNPVRAAGPGGGSGGGIPGTENTATNRAARQYSKNTGWTYASVRPIAVRVARQPFRVGNITERSKDKKESPESFAAKHRLPCHLKTQLSENTEVTLLTKHKMLQALADPNPMMTEWALKYITAAALQLTGWGFWWIWATDDKRNGTDYDIWPIPTHWVQKNEKQKGWDVTLPGASRSTFVPAADMAVFYYPDPENPSKARGPMDAAEMVAGTSEKITTAQSATFDNVAMPTIIFRSAVQESADGRKSLPEYTDPQKESIRQTLNQLYRNVHKWGRFLVTDNVIEDVDLLSQKPFEMDFQQSGQMVKEEIQQIFGVNPAVAGQLENSNRASATVATESFLDNVVNPLLTMMSQVLNQWVLPKFQEVAKKVAGTISAWIEEAVAYDPDGKRANLQLLSNLNGLTVDDLRFSLEGLPPMENGWGRGMWVRAGTSFQSIDQTPDQARAEAQRRQDEQNAAKLAQRTPSPAADKAMSGSFSSLWLKTHGFHEDELTRALRGFFRRQSDAILQRVRAAELEWNPDAVFNPTDWDMALLTTVEVPLARAGFQGAARGQILMRKDSVDSVLTTLPTEVQIAIRATLKDVLAQDYWAEINLQTQWKLRNLFQQMTTNGWDLSQQIAGIQKVLGVQGARAELIARTETTGMLNAGAHAVAMELAGDGLVDTKTWLATEDEVTREAHVLANGQTVKVSDLFVLFDPETGLTEYAPYPGYHKLSAKQRCNCRCTPTTSSDQMMGFAA